MAVIHDPIHQPEGRIEVKNTTCYMCACRCGIRVTLRDGEVRYIQGNPDHPLNKGIICAKGSSGIMKQYSPARLTKPLRRKPGADRGDAQFEEISWDEAFDMLEERLGNLRATDPKKFALFTGRDQMQAMTGLFAGQKCAVDFDPLVINNITILGSLGGPSVWDEAIELHERGKVTAAPLITHRLPLEDFVEGIEIMRNRTDNALKVVLEP